MNTSIPLTPFIPFSQNTSRLRYPPYSRNLRDQIAQGVLPRLGVWLFLGPEAFDQAKIHLCSTRSVLVLPDGEDPEAFVWPVKDLPVVIFDRLPTGSDELFLKRLAYSLLAAGASVVLLHRTHDSLVVFQQDSIRRTFP